VDKKKSSRGGGKRAWGYRYKFDTSPTRVHFSLPDKLYVHPETGDELPFRVGSRYWIPKGGPKGTGCFIEQGSNCVVDVYKNPKNFGLDIPPIANFQKYDAKLYYSVAGWVEEWFHEVEVQNNEGRKWKELQRCEGPGCKLCQEKWMKVFGKRVYFDIAPTHWNESIFTAQESEAQCHCQCGGFTHISHYVCQKCRKSLVDVTQACYNCKSTEVGIDPKDKLAVCQNCNSEWSVLERGNPEIAKVVNDDITCSNCGHVDMPDPVFECSDCDDPKPHGIFDCQMKISIVETRDGKAKELKVEGVKVQEPDSRLFNPQHQGTDKERAEKRAKWNKAPLDLEDLLQPEDAENQAQLLGVANPFTSSAGGRGYKDFSRNQGSQEESQEETQESQEETQEATRRPPPKGPNRTRASIGRRS